MRVVASLAVALLASGAGHLHAQATAAIPASVPIPAAIERVLRDYESAWRARDADALATLFTEDGFVLSNGRPPAHGRAAIRRHYAGSGGELKLRAIGYAESGNIAYVVGMFGGSSAVETGKFVLVLRRTARDTPWLIAADMDNPNQRME